MAMAIDIYAFNTETPKSSLKLYVDHRYKETFFISMM